MKDSGTYKNKVSTLSYKMTENDKQAEVGITLKIQFPFKYLAHKLPLALLKFHQSIEEVYDEYHDTPHLEAVKLLLEIADSLGSLKRSVENDLIKKIHQSGKENHTLLCGAEYTEEGDIPGIEVNCPKCLLLIVERKE